MKKKEPAKKNVADQQAERVGREKQKALELALLQIEKGAKIKGLEGLTVRK